MAYAIIKTGGRQFRVAEGDTIDVDLLDVDSGKTATFGEVLMFADGKDVTHGNPLVSGAKVTAEVLEQRKDKKVIAFKYQAAQRLSPHGWASPQIDAREDQEHQCRSEKGVDKEDRRLNARYQLSTNNFPMAHKKGQGSVKNGRDSVSKRLGVKNSAAKWSSPATLSFASAGQNSCLEKTSDSAGITRFLRWSTEACASIVLGDGLMSIRCVTGN